MIPELPTPQEKFIELYESSKKQNDVARYHDAVTKWEEIYQMKVWYTNYRSFKNAHRSHIVKNRNS